MLSAFLATGCSSDPPPPKCATIDLACTPAYEPTFEKVFSSTLSPSCALGGGSCHASSTKLNTLIMENADSAYKLLLERGHVRPGDAACSPVVGRLASSDPYARMPPAGAISLGEQCAIEQWIARGAKR